MNCLQRLQRYLPEWIQPVTPVDNENQAAILRANEYKFIFLGSSIADLTIAAIRVSSSAAMGGMWLAVAYQSYEGVRIVHNIQLLYCDSTNIILSAEEIFERITEGAPVARRFGRWLDPEIIKTVLYQPPQHP